MHTHTHTHITALGSHFLSVISQRSDRFISPQLSLIIISFPNTHTYTHTRTHYLCVATLKEPVMDDSKNHCGHRVVFFYTDEQFEFVIQTHMGPPPEKQSHTHAHTHAHTQTHRPTHAHTQTHILTETHTHTAHTPGNAAEIPSVQSLVPTQPPR